jgi:hypothetical protein
MCSFLLYVNTKIPWSNERKTKIVCVQYKFVWLWNCWKWYNPLDIRIWLCEHLSRSKPHAAYEYTPKFQLEEYSSQSCAAVIQIFLMWVIVHEYNRAGWYNSKALKVYWEGARSNIGRDTGYPEWKFSCFSSVRQAKCRDNSSVRPRRLRSKSFPIHQSTHHMMLYSLDQPCTHFLRL